MTGPYGQKDTIRKHPERTVTSLVRAILNLMACHVAFRRSPRHGLGVFAVAPIPAGDVVERCPVLVVPAAEADALNESSLAGHLWDWGDGEVAIALGCGSLYNHDPAPNAMVDQDGDELVVIACDDIPAGLEITIDYTDGGRLELWFDT